MLELSPCAPLENLRAPLSLSAPSPAPRYIPGPGQAPTRPGSASSPPLLSTQGSSPWRQPSSQQARNGKRRVRVPGMSQRHRALQVGLHEGLARMSPIAPWPSLYLLKWHVRGQSGEGHGARWLVRPSERCKIPFPTHSWLEKRQEAAVLVPAVLPRAAAC